MRLAVDGKAVRGAKGKDGKVPHLVAALAHAKAASKCMSVPGRYCWRMDREPTGAESGTLMVKECASAAHTGTVRLPGTS